MFSSCLYGPVIGLPTRGFCAAHSRDSRNSRPRDFSILKKRNNLVTLQPLPAFQSFKLDDEAHGHNLATKPFNKANRRETCSTGSEQVIGNNNAHARLDGVLVHLQRVHAVLQLVRDALDGRGQLVRLANGYEAGMKVIGQSGGKDETASLDAEDEVGPEWTNPLRKVVDDFAETSLVLEQRCDVIKENALFRKIGDLADQFLQLVHIQPRIRNDEYSPETGRSYSMMFVTRAIRGPRSSSCLNDSSASSSPTACTSTSPPGKLRT